MLLALAVTACGSDSPSEQRTHPDASVGGTDAPGAGRDVVVTPDTYDSAVPNAEVAVTPETNDIPMDTSDATHPEADAVEVLALASPDTSAPEAAIDSSPSFPRSDADIESDTGALEVAIDSTPAGFPCRSDSDCCIKIDNCMNIAYLYSKAPGAAAPPPIPSPDAGVCTACIPPAIQVRCMSGQCIGERISGYPSSLLHDHCGYVTLADGGLTALQEIIDAGSVSTKSVWTCGGG